MENREFALFYQEFYQIACAIKAVTFTCFHQFGLFYFVLFEQHIPAQTLNINNEFM